MSSAKTIKIFSALGAEILSGKDVFEKRFKNAKGILLDWDGVFNEGLKGENSANTFSEIDAMGLNLLRFALWNYTKKIPEGFIISGINNQAAYHFADRECFNGVYLSFKDKRLALQHIQDNFNIQPSELICVFDDVLDLSIAKDCGLRFLVNRKANPLFVKYVKNKKWCDYITANSSGEYPIREVCEFLIGMSGEYETILDNRINFSETYAQYWDDRNAQKPKRYMCKEGKVIEE